MARRNAPATSQDYDDPLGPPPTDGDDGFWPEPAAMAKPVPRAAPRRVDGSFEPRQPKAATEPVGLVEASEPLFALICRLNRAARKGGLATTPDQVRQQIRQALDASRRRYLANRPDPRDAQTAERQWEKAKKPLVFFADYQVRNSALPFAFDWQDIAEEDFEEIVGDERFFKVVDGDLAKETPTSLERLALYHECMGLGFHGMYASEPREVLNRMKQCRTAIAKKRGADAFDKPGSRLTPDAYDHTDRSDLPPEKTGRLLTYVLVGAVGLIAVMLALTFYVYRSQTAAYTGALDRLSDGQAVENAGE